MSVQALMHQVSLEGQPQAPAEQMRPPLHTVQAPPPTPQAEELAPGWHVSVDGSIQPLQAGVWHAPDVQVCPPEHTAQEPPPVPQAEVVFPVSQVPEASTQPAQDGATQMPPVHDCEPVQTSQLPPPVPHADVEVPPWQVPVESTHPVQVVWVVTGQVLPELRWSMHCPSQSDQIS